MRRWWSLKMPDVMKELPRLERRALWGECYRKVWRDKCLWLCFGVSLLWFIAVMYLVIEIDALLSGIILAILGGVGTLLPCGRAMALTAHHAERFLEEHGGKVEPELVIRYLRRRCTVQTVFAIAFYVAFVVAMVVAGRVWVGKLTLEFNAGRMATHAGLLQAEQDARDGKLRLYELSKGSEEEFTGRKEGVFEIWSWPCFPDFGGASRRCDEEFVQSYNGMMRAIQDDRADEAHDPPK